MLDGELPPGFERRVVVLRPGGRQMYRGCDWKDAIVFVDQGEILLEAANGVASCRFRRGDLVSLAGLDLRAIYNSGPEPAVLIAVWRRPPSNPKETT